MYGSKETIPGKRLVVSSSWPYKVNGKALLHKFCGFKLTFYIMACILDVIFDDNRPLKFTIMCYRYSDKKYYNYPQANGYIIPKMDKFLPIDNNDNYGYDPSYRCYTRSFSGRMTKKRWQIIDRFCRTRSRSPRYRCGHDWDCCGCMCGQNMSFKYQFNQVTIRLSHSYNY